MSDKRRTKLDTVYAIALFFAVVSLVTIFTNTLDLAFVMNNYFSGAGSPSLDEGDYRLITTGYIATLLILVALASVVFNLIIKQKTNAYDKLIKISDLVVSITSTVAVLYMLITIIIFGTSLPYSDFWQQEGETRYLTSSFVLFVEFRNMLLQAVLTLVILGGCHLLNFLNSKDNKEV